MPTLRLPTVALLALSAISFPTVSLAQAEAPTPAPAAEAPVDIGHQVPPGFTTDLAAARAAAKKADRPLLLMFCTPHCNPCNQLKRSVLPRPEVRDNLAEYELVYVNVDDSQDVAKEFKINSYPTFVLVTPAGREIGRTGGGSDDPVNFLRGMEGLRHTHERRSGISAALAKNPQDPALLVARARLLFDAADHSDFAQRTPLIQKATADLKAAAALDSKGQTGAAAELELDGHSGKPMTEAQYKLEGAKELAQWKAHPDLRRADLVLWSAINSMPEKEANLWRLEFLRRYPDSPQADLFWPNLEDAPASASNQDTESKPASSVVNPPPAPHAAELLVAEGPQIPLGFGTDLAAAREAAHKADRPLLVMFSLPYSESCNQLKRSVLPKPETRLHLAEYELAHVDADASPALAREFKVFSYPTFVLLTPAGREIGRTSGGSESTAAFFRSLETMRHARERRAGLAMALAKTPQDPALMVARARRTLDVAEQSHRPGPLRQTALEDLKAAALLDPEGKTDAAAEVAWLALEERSRQPMTSEEYAAIGQETLALWKAHPHLRRADLVLWSAIGDMPKKVGYRSWLEFVRRYPDSPKADLAWQALADALRNP